MMFDVLPRFWRGGEGGKRNRKHFSTRKNGKVKTTIVPNRTATELATRLEKL